MTNRHVLTSYHGFHSDHPHDRRYPRASAVLKVAVGVSVAWLLVTLLLCLGR